MMKKTLPFLFSLTLSLTSAQVFAAQECAVNIENEFQVSDETITVYDKQGNEVVIQGDQIITDKETIALTPEQRESLERFRKNLDHMLERAEKASDETLVLANSLLDELGESFGDKQAFADIKKSIAELYDEYRQQFFDGETWSLKRESLTDTLSSSSEEFEALIKQLYNQVAAKVLLLLSEQMSEEDGLNLNVLQEKMSELKNSIKGRIDQHKQHMKTESEALCEQLKVLEQDQKVLQEQIPQLEEYDLFSI